MQGSLFAEDKGLPFSTAVSPHSKLDTKGTLFRRNSTSPRVGWLRCRTVQGGDRPPPRPHLTEPSRDASFLLNALSVPSPLPPLSLSHLLVVMNWTRPAAPRMTNSSVISLWSRRRKSERNMDAVMSALKALNRTWNTPNAHILAPKTVSVQKMIWFRNRCINSHKCGIKQNTWPPLITPLFHAKELENKLSQKAGPWLTRILECSLQLVLKREVRASCTHTPSKCQMTGAEKARLPRRRKSRQTSGVVQGR